MRRLVRKLHTIIKMVHHLQNVAPKDGKPEPRMIARMVDVLANMIKPAAPTQHTVDLISGNARNWGHTACVILMEHYETKLEDLLGELAGLIAPDWKSAFAVAVRWARRNLPRITQDAIDHAEAMVAARVDTLHPGQGRDPSQTGSTTGDQRSIPQQTETSVQLGAQPPPVLRTTVATMTDQPDKGTDEDRPVPRTPSPKERREAPRGARRSRGVVLREDDDEIQELDTEQSGDFRVWESPVRTPSQLEREAALDRLLAEEERLEEEAQEAIRVCQSTGTRAPQPTEQTVQAQVHQEDSDEEDVFEQSFDLFVSPEQPRYQVYRHPNTTRKMTEWNWVAKRKWVILGDSNLARLPDYFSKHLQVESFPGANFRHAEALMRKTVAPQDLVVEKVVLSFGINSRGNKPKETTVKNVQAAIRATRTRFPYAEVWVPLVNFSRTLPAEEQENLQTLNDHMERNMSFIPLLPEGQFQTEDDGIHWTVETGRAMFEHWSSILNFYAP